MVPDIARRFHIPAGTVLPVPKREGWQISTIMGRRKLAAQPIIEKAVQVSRDFVRDNDVKSRTSLSTAVAKAASHLENLPGPVIVENHQALEGVTRAGDIMRHAICMSSLSCRLSGDPPNFDHH